MNKNMCVRWVVVAAWVFGITTIGGCNQEPEAPQETVSGQNVGEQKGIYQGVDATVGEYPWQVHLRIPGSFGCGGSILNEQWVVTAAHCVGGKKLSDITVLAGGVDVNLLHPFPGQTRGIEKIVIHPSFDYSQKAYSPGDIALLKLSSPLTFDKNVQSITISSNPEHFRLRNEVTVTGWGTSSVPEDRILKQGKMIIARTESGTIPGWWDYVSKFEHYTLGLLPGPNYAQNGDSGGPAVWYDNGKPYLVGITGGGLIFGGANDYLNPYYFRSWIYSFYKTTVATVAGGGSGYVDGVGSRAKFSYPSDVVVDAANNIYITEFGNNSIRKITPDGTVSTFVKPGTFNGPMGLSIDDAGNLYVADTYNNRICKVTPDGVVNTLVGSGAYGYRDGSLKTASFRSPMDVVVKGNGYEMLIADTYNNCIRKVSLLLETVTTLAGSTIAGYQDGSPTSAKFDLPYSIAWDENRNIVYVSDQQNHRIRRITLNDSRNAKEVSLLAGSVMGGHLDGVGSKARFNLPRGIALASDGGVLVADYKNFAIRKVSPKGMVETCAGTGGRSGYQDGVAADALFSYMMSLTVDKHGNLVVVDTDRNHKIRRVTF